MRRRFPRHVEFGRESDEPMPDLGNVPWDLFEFYTPPGTYFDVLPIHVLSMSAVQTMRTLAPSASWDVRRFRPNVLIQAATDEGHVERHWVGRTVQIGGFAIRGEMPTIRCAMTMHAQKELPSDPLVLRAIVRDADQCLGLYASGVASGTISVGDPVVEASKLLMNSATLAARQGFDGEWFRREAEMGRV